MSWGKVDFLSTDNRQLMVVQVIVLKWFRNDADIVEIIVHILSFNFDQL